MRPNQNKRMRGRNGGNRKGPNPLSRTYESNGPDVKIRGTAHHIGEKYLQLARDAQSSGDPVMAESFLQHAEHYFRLIAAAQAAQQQAAAGYQRPAGEQDTEDLEEEEEFVGGMDRFASPLERASNAPPNYQPQPASQPAYPDRERGYGNGGERPYYERPERQDRGPRQDHRGERGERGDRHERHDRGYSERQPQGGRDRDDQRGRRQGRDFRGESGGRYERGEPRGSSEETEGPKGLPAFITAPVRLQPEPHLSDGQPNEADILDASDAEGDFQMRQRRRRRRPDLGEGPTEVTSATDPVSD